MKILVLGGTRFFGKVLVESLIKNNHDVTIATRGITKDGFGKSIKRIILNRDSKESMEVALNGEKFDVVYDNINYSSNDAKRILDIIETDKYILTSSAAVYQEGINIKEEEFNPSKYKLEMGNRADFTYKEGKRQCEAYLAQKYDKNFVIVRFPVVLGEEDYTKRLFSYVENMMLKKPMYIDNLDSKLSFISYKLAGEFLAFLVDKDFNRSINAAFHGYITLRKIINYIERATDIKVELLEAGLPGNYNGFGDCYINTENANNLGFKFDNIEEYVYGLVDYYISILNG